MTCLPHETLRRQQEPLHPEPVPATPATESEDRRRKVPYVPRKATMDATKCHACHARCRGVHGNLPPQSVQYPKCHACHTKWRRKSPTVMPVTQENSCAVPRKVKTDVQWKRRGMLPSVLVVWEQNGWGLNVYEKVVCGQVVCGHGVCI
jgi:hypothetical protein